MNLVMYSSILSSIILVFVGLVKLPLVKFKQKKWYKVTLTLFTMALVIGACLVCQKYIICANIISMDMLYLLFITFGETMVSYNGVYEGLGVKKGFNLLFKKIGELIKKAPEDKVVDYEKKLNKLTNTVNELVGKINLAKSEIQQEKQNEAK